MVETEIKRTQANKKNSKLRRNKRNPEQKSGREGELRRNALVIEHKAPLDGIHGSISSGIHGGVGGERAAGDPSEEGARGGNRRSETTFGREGNGRGERERGFEEVRGY